MLRRLEEIPAHWARLRPDAVVLHEEDRQWTWRELDAARIQAKSMPHASLAEMADATFAVYDEALAGESEPAQKPFSRARIRDALGYRAWTPPRVVSAITQTDGAPAPGLLSTRLAHAALAIRRRVATLFGEQLSLRIGIDTGDVVVGRGGNGGSLKGATITAAAS